jgi:5-methylcytosine-specific restriction endonuclease McrA
MIDPGRTNDEYKKWRNSVKKRDRGKCQWPGCKKRGQEAHHILPYSMFPHLRYEVTNGIFFCRTCHSKLKGKEGYYVGFCMSLLERNKLK